MVVDHFPLGSAAVFSLLIRLAMTLIPPRPGVMPPRAGILYDRGEGGVSNCVREERRPQTPAAIRKWRRSGASQPGQRILHPGQVGDLKEFDPKVSFGSGGVKASDHVVDVWCQVSMYSTVKNLFRVFPP